MAAINELISQIEDKTLRDRIQEEVNRLEKRKKFGLVYEEHMPECTPLYDISIKKGAKVALRAQKIDEVYMVTKLEDGIATCITRDCKNPVQFPVSDLVTIAEFGDPIYPYLKPIDTVCNAPDSDLWHTLIEADNYHALQLLEYLYAGKVDCIYICFFATTTSSDFLQSVLLPCVIGTCWQYLVIRRLQDLPGMQLAPCLLALLSNADGASLFSQ